jgi:hypothetical protein
MDLRVALDDRDRVLPREPRQLAVDPLQQVVRDRPARVDDGQDAGSGGLTTPARQDADQLGEPTRRPIEDRPRLERLAHVAPQQGAPIEVALRVTPQLVFAPARSGADPRGPDGRLQSVRQAVGADFEDGPGDHLTDGLAGSPRFDPRLLPDGMVIDGTASVDEVARPALKASSPPGAASR